MTDSFTYTTGWQFPDPKDQEGFNKYITLRNQQVVEMKLLGATSQQIADLMGLSKTYVVDIAHKMGVYGRPVVKKRKQIQQTLF